MEPIRKAQTLLYFFAVCFRLLPGAVRFSIKIVADPSNKMDVDEEHALYMYKRIIETRNSNEQITLVSGGDRKRYPSRSQWAIMRNRR